MAGRTGERRGLVAVKLSVTVLFVAKLGAQVVRPLMAGRAILFGHCERRRTAMKLA